jgi:hypothetical protein
MTPMGSHWLSCKSINAMENQSKFATEINGCYGKSKVVINGCYEKSLATCTHSALLSSVVEHLTCSKSFNKTLLNTCLTFLKNIINMDF